MLSSVASLCSEHQLQFGSQYSTDSLHSPQCNSAVTVSFTAPCAMHSPPSATQLSLQRDFPLPAVPLVLIVTYALWELAILFQPVLLESSGHLSLPRRLWHSRLWIYAILVAPSDTYLPFCEQDPQDTDHLVAPLFSRSLTGVVKSVSKKWLLHSYFTYKFLTSSVLQDWLIFWAHKWEL